MIVCFTPTTEESDDYISYRMLEHENNDPKMMKEFLNEKSILVEIQSSSNFPSSPLDQALSARFDQGLSDDQTRVALVPSRHWVGYELRIYHEPITVSDINKIRHNARKYGSARFDHEVVHRVEESCWKDPRYTVAKTESGTWVLHFDGSIPKPIKNKTGPQSQKWIKRRDCLKFLRAVRQSVHSLLGFRISLNDHNFRLTHQFLKQAGISGKKLKKQIDKHLKDETIEAFAARVLKTNADWQKENRKTIRAVERLCHGTKNGTRTS